MRKKVVRQRYWFLGVMVMMALLVTVGCAKKAAVEQPPTAVAATPPPAQPAPAPAAPAQPRTVTEDPLAQQRRQFESEDINFDFDRSEITPRSREILNRKGQFLLANRDIAILIEGHCDERGTDEYNLALGERRANSAKQYLMALGVAADRMSTISYGEERPLDPAKNETAWAKNRRAHFVIVRRPGA